MLLSLTTELTSIGNIAIIIIITIIISIIINIMIIIT